MATYKVALTVKDRYGKLKKLDSGVIDVGLDGLTDKDFAEIEETLPLEKYVKKEELGDYVPEQKSQVYVPTVTASNMLIFDLKDSATDERLVYDIDKSNDWNPMEETNSSSYEWEPM